MELAVVTPTGTLQLCHLNENDGDGSFYISVSWLPLNGKQFRGFLTSVFVLEMDTLDVKHSPNVENPSSPSDLSTSGSEGRTVKNDHARVQESTAMRKSHPQCLPVSYLVEIGPM